MTSDDPTKKHQPPDDRNGASTNDSQAAPQLLPAAQVAPIQVPPTPYHCQITCKTEKDWRDKVKFWAELVGLFFLIIYTLATIGYLYMAVRQWREMIAVRHQAQGAIDAANRSAAAAERANQLATNADRPWFGAFLAGVKEFEVGKMPEATVVFTNSGKRPARVIIGETNTHWFDKFPPNPPYEHQTVSTAVIVPNSAVINKFNMSKNPLSQLEIDTATAGTPAKYFIYGNIEYIDIETGIKHHTHACWTYVGNDPALAKGFYGCNVYQDAD